MAVKYQFNKTFRFHVPGDRYPTQFNPRDPVPAEPPEILKEARKAKVIEPMAKPRASKPVQRPKTLTIGQRREEEKRKAKSSAKQKLKGGKAVTTVGPARGKKKAE